MGRRRILAACATALAVTGGALGMVPAHAAPSSGSAAARAGDLDGDGFGDLAVGSPSGTIAGYAKAGYVSVMYGTAQGVRTTRHKGITQQTSGIPGTPEAGDRFGSAVAVGDVDGDGYADLVIGAGGEAIGTVKGAGSVTVVFGAKGGLGNKAIAFNAPTPTARQGFGDRITVGDFDHDGRDDIAVVAGTKVQVVKGAAKLRDTAKPAMKAYTPPGGGVATGQIAAADVNGDGYTDLATVAAFDDPADEGTLGVLAGSASGLTTKTLGKTGLPFEGYSIVAGDVTGDGKDDIVIDTSFEDGPGDYLLRLYPGTTAGLGAGVAYGGSARPGSVTGLADFDGDGHADLVTSDTGAPDPDGFNNAGAVTVVKGTGSGLDAAHQQTITLDTPGVAGASEGNDLFGRAVAAGDYDADGKADLTVGVPGKYLGTGAVSVLPGSTMGPTGTNSILVNPEYLDHPTLKAAFGSALGATTRP
ncbi:FG-GAP-like repeat-containing protein [Streptomyces sp. NPDC058305]|uniref:FG-GAP-like repeat-containing protein n=1 Tax=Streptomyces sp. NPDC058305 TaxID=3346438 RepID=UPI0036E4F7B1